MTSPVVVLIGPPGAGKSHIGRALAEYLGVGFRDTDTDIERSAGCRIAQILEREGEAHFRVRERRAVHRALAGHSGVLALGGGAVLEEATQRRLGRHRVVHLAVAPQQLAARIGSAATRPLLADDPEGRLRTLLAVRNPIYRRLATWTVPAGGRSHLVVARIATLLAELPAAHGPAPAAARPPGPPARSGAAAHRGPGDPLGREVGGGLGRAAELKTGDQLRLHQPGHQQRPPAGHPLQQVGPAAQHL
ncbi:shikimate kinase [Kitasatospora gansuensis]|uniref:Shikimate kinase n=1 Tax=Kitasatospora gansuensis TaxID=258050 RepID=A0A7W7WID9_9ACTN|nr:shikimate kinase [Kitasatospora gansuensis]